jgi:hypothetical protein
MTKGDLKRFEIKANWRKYGPAAGPIRNQQMLDWGPDLVVAFAGGTGTAGMVALARAAGVPVIEPAAYRRRTCRPHGLKSSRFSGLLKTSKVPKNKGFFQFLLKEQKAHRNPPGPNRP